MQEWNLNGVEEPGVVILTAHPDDETIFCGGMMLTYPKWNWQIICVTMQPGIRSQEFEKAIARFKYKGVNIVKHQVLGKADNGQPLSNQDYADWLSSINRLNLNPDIVFTHNLMGEYGHPHHMSVNKIAHELYQNVWNFLFPGETNVAEQVVKEKTNKVELTPSILNAKNEVFKTAYGSQEGLWEALPDVMEYEFKLGPELFTA